MGQLGLEWKQEDVVNDPGLEIRKASKLMLEVHIAFSLLDPSDIIQAHEFENNNMVYVSLSFFIYQSTQSAAIAIPFLF